MNLTLFSERFTVCQLLNMDNLDKLEFPYFISATPDEISLVCKTTQAPLAIRNRKDDFKMLKIDGVLDFGLVGILAKISSLLAKSKISIFAISTYNTDYILVSESDCLKTCTILQENGYTIARV